MQLTKNTNDNYTIRQLKLPLDIEKIIDISDPVYSFSEIMDSIDFTIYFSVKESKTGRPKYNPTIMLKVILFSFMENGYLSLRKMEKSCKTDIRYMWLLDGMAAPSFATFGNFIREELTDSIENIFLAINQVIFEKDQVDLNHVYIDGTKIEANANKYTWVWKKSCINNRDKVFVKVTELLEQINKEELCFLGVEFETRTEYAIEYLDQILQKYKEVYGLVPEKFVSGKGHRKSIQQRHYQQLEEYRFRLSNYANHIEICGESRNSYSKTDKSATFMRVKKDYMGNDQLLPAYNMQIAVCDEYIAAIDVKQYASDMDCFVPLMEKFMKFTMFEKETKDKKYKDNPYRAVNFKQDEDGKLICPQNQKFHLKYTRPVRGNKYGRTEEVYECENCKGCPYKEKCCPKAKGNRTIRMNRELTAIHEEVVSNLCSIHGALLCMNRSIQSEGAFGVMKWDRSYKRAFRRGLKSVFLEFCLISCGFNLYKYHNRHQRSMKCA